MGKKNVERTQRHHRRMQLIFGIIAILVILSWILSLIVNI